MYPNLSILKVGDRIRLEEMPDDPDPVPAGTCGTVTLVQPEIQHVAVKWDNGRTLNLVCPPDRFVLLL